MTNLKWGFKDLVNRRELFTSATTLASHLKQSRPELTTIAVIGIGGSTVGTEALWNILSPAQPARQIVIFDNVDFSDAQRKWDKLKPQNTLWYIVSKSGSTLETLSMTEWISQKHQQLGLSFYQNCVVCTENQNNLLHNWAQKNKIPCLEIPLDVGGRFSVLTPVGIFPLAFAGVDSEALMTGARTAIEEQGSIRELAARCTQSFDQHPITVFWFYSSMMKSFGAWIQQLWAESLAKKHNRQGQLAKQGSTPYFAVGTCDQHSILQQVAEGARDKFVIFFRCHELENFNQTLSMQEFPSLGYLQNKPAGNIIKAAAEGTERALQQAGVSTHRIYYPDHSARTIGYLVMWFELLVGEIGEQLDINAFDQPGVEGSKKITKEILSQ